jgi:hypothetical protein
MNKEYENLVETSNQHHDAVYDYIEKHGVDEQFEVMLQGKYRWLLMLARKNNIELTE